MKASRKQVTFDLDTKALEIYYPKDNWREAYKVIKRHMLKNGFTWIEGSVYVSKTAMTAMAVTNILDEFIKKNPWVNICMRDCRQANLGKEHSSNHLFDKNAKVPTRDELNNINPKHPPLKDVMENAKQRSKTNPYQQKNSLKNKER